MIINNSAHKIYLSNKLQYSDIIKYIMNELQNNSKNIKLTTFDAILRFIISTNNKYNTNV